MASGQGGFPRGSGADLAPEQMTILIDFTGYRQTRFASQRAFTPGFGIRTGVRRRS
jgi:hypothetical protein